MRSTSALAARKRPRQRARERFRRGWRRRCRKEAVEGARAEAEASQPPPSSTKTKGRTFFHTRGANTVAESHHPRLLRRRRPAPLSCSSASPSSLPATSTSSSSSAPVPPASAVGRRDGRDGGGGGRGDRRAPQRHQLEVGEDQSGGLFGGGVQRKRRQAFVVVRSVNGEGRERREGGEKRKRVGLGTSLIESGRWGGARFFPCARRSGRWGRRKISAPIEIASPCALAEVAAIVSASPKRTATCFLKAVIWGSCYGGAILPHRSWRAGKQKDDGGQSGLTVDLILHRSPPRSQDITRLVYFECMCIETSSQIIFLSRSRAQRERERSAARARARAAPRHRSGPAKATAPLPHTHTPHRPR